MYIKVDTLYPCAFRVLEPIDPCSSSAHISHSRGHLCEIICGDRYELMPLQFLDQQMKKFEKEELVLGQQDRAPWQDISLRN